MIPKNKLRKIYSAYGVIVDEGAMVTNAKYNVYIKMLMPMIEQGAPEEKPEVLGIKPRFHTTNFEPEKKITLSNSIEAQSKTPFRTEVKGQVKEMASSVAESETGKPPFGSITSHIKEAPHQPHMHETKKPMEFVDMVYSELDAEIEVPSGTKCIVEFIGGDLNECWVSNVENLLPKD